MTSSKASATFHEFNFACHAFDLAQATHKLVKSDKFGTKNDLALPTIQKFGGARLMNFCPSALLDLQFSGGCKQGRENMEGGEGNSD
jgi:hypothetical protein